MMTRKTPRDRLRGNTVTALYQVVPASKSVDVPGADPLKYQQAAKPASVVPASGEMLTLKIRLQEAQRRPPARSWSSRSPTPVAPSPRRPTIFSLPQVSPALGCSWRGSEHRGSTSYAAVQEIAEGGMGRDLHEYRAEFLQLVKRAKQLAGE